MKKIILLILTTITFNDIIAQFPVVIENIAGLGIYIHEDPDYYSDNIALTYDGSKWVATDFEYDAGGAGGNIYWFEIDIPDHYSSSSGWVSNGFLMVYGEPGYMLPDCDADFVEITTATLSIRESAGVGELNITIGGLYAYAWDGQRFACTGNTEDIAGTTWYEIYLPSNCSESTGWCSEGGDGTLLDFNSSGEGDCDVPDEPTSFDVDALSESEIQLDWNDPGGLVDGYVIYHCDFPFAFNYTTETDYVEDGLTPGTEYDYYIKAYNMYGASDETSCKSATTDGGDCDEPSSQADEINIDDAGTNYITLSWDQGNGDRTLVKINTSNSFTSPTNGTDPLPNTTYAGFGQQVIFNDYGNNVTVSGLNPGTTYYFHAYEANCFGVNSIYNPDDDTDNPEPGTTDDAIGCGTPFGLIADPSTTTANLSWNFSGTYELFNIRFRIVGAASWNYTTSSLLTKSIYSLVPNNDYEWQVQADCGVTLGSYTSSNYFTTDEIESTIIITTENIPGWQRDNEPGGFSGNITVTTTPPGDDWRLEVYKNGGLTPIKIYYSTGVSTLDFESGDFGTWNDGDNISYYAVHDIDNSSSMAATHTIIIEEKWYNKNIYLKNNDAIQMKIPIKYDALASVDYLIIERDEELGKVSLTIHPVDMTPDGILSYDAINNKFYPSDDGYCYLNFGNTQNIKTVLPGDFKVTAFNNLSEIPLETFKFDLTKYGQILSNNENDNVLVMIGGFSNNIEESSEYIKNNYSSCKQQSSNATYSLVAYIEDKAVNHEFNVWYIAMGNANTIKRNGYDIGKALETILEETGASEIDIICHSKGGLDLRAYLQNQTSPYGLGIPIGYGLDDSPLMGKIEKVLFLGTPHAGSNWTELLTGVFDVFYYSPGAEDLEFGSNIIDILNSSSMPNDIEYANLAGYQSEQENIGIFDLPIYTNEANDGPVSVESNISFFNTFSYDYYLGGNCTVKQMFQYTFDHSFFEPSHFDEHRNNYLAESNEYFNDYDCIEPPEYMNNLAKIVSFFDEYAPYSTYTPFSFCPIPSFDPIYIDIFGSKISGALISLKRSESLDYNLIGLTDEEGSYRGVFMPALNYGDSIKIYAPGYETLIVGIDSTILNIKKIEIPMMNNADLTLNIKGPTIILNESSYISDEPSVNLTCFGANVVSFKINSPLNQDSIFVPLTLIDSSFNLLLDTGCNVLKVQFIGLIDTIVITKYLYYYPSAIYNDWTRNVTINIDSMSSGVKVYVNNQYFNRIYESTNLDILKGHYEIGFSKFGYKDTSIVIKSDTAITVSNYLSTVSYYSFTDSTVFDFNENEIGYWKNITLLDSSQIVILTAKQVVDLFGTNGLIPKTRKFELTHINEYWSNIRFAAILDQIENLNRDSIYFMKIYDDSIFNKIQFDTTGNIVTYDSSVQKLSFNYINFNEGLATKESLIIMKKQPPIPHSGVLNTNMNNTMILPLSLFFNDPDSIKNDLSIIISGLSAGLNASIIGDSIIIYPDECWTGQGYITLEGTHDWLTRSLTDTINVINTEAPEIFYEASLIICEGESITLSTDLTTGIFWSTGETTPSIIVSEPGDYFVGHFGECGLASSDTLTVTINNLPESSFNFSLDNLTASFSNLSIDADSYIWQFGDGSISSEENPTHIYPIADSYLVTLTAIDSCGLSVYSDSLIIGLPDITGTIDYVTPVVQYGDSLHITVTIINNGESTAKDFDGDPFVNRIKLSHDDCTFLDDILIDFFYIDSLLPEQSMTFIKSFYIDASYPIDTFFVLLAPNAAEKVVEVTYADNQICSEPDTVFIIDSTCYFTLPLTEVTVPNGPSSSEFEINTLYDCDWNITSVPPWINITSGMSGIGNSIISYDVEENEICIERVGIIIIAGLPYTITQEANTATYNLSSESVNVPYAGGTGSLVVTASAECNWDASTISTWVHFDSGPHTGSTEFFYEVDTNYAAITRSTTINIAGQSFNITQEGKVGILNVPGGFIKIYPNPVTDKVIIECSTEQIAADIRLTNALGQEVEGIKITMVSSCKYICDLNNVPNGTYFINFKINGGDYNYQIIVSH